MSYPDHLHNHLGDIASALNVATADLTIIKMTNGPDERHKELELLQGSWEDEHPWVIVDDKDNLYTLAQAESLSKIFALFAATQGENFQFKLEKAIWQRFPIDFYDVWAVAMDRIKRQAKNQPDSTVIKLDLDWLVAEIKQEYPNLFYHLDQMLTQEQQ